MDSNDEYDVTVTREGTFKRIPGTNQCTVTPLPPGSEFGTPGAWMVEAAEMKDWGSVCLFLHDGTNPDARDEEGNTALGFASYQGNANMVSSLLDDYHADVNTHTEEGVTPLMFASNLGHTEVVKILLAHGANINVQMNEGWSALHDASYNGRVDIVNLLLRAHCDTTLKTHKGETASMLARDVGHMNIVEAIDGDTHNI
jgi:ankyrin repeat protein